MRSIYAKILLWTLGTFASSLVAFGAISYSLATRSPGPGDFFARTRSMLEEEAIRSFEEGGASRLADYLKRLDHYYAPGTSSPTPRAATWSTARTARRCWRMPPTRRIRSACPAATSSSSGDSAGVVIGSSSP